MKILTAILCASSFLISAYPAERLPAAISLDDFNLVGEFGHGEAAFTLRATARVENAKGGSLDLLCGQIALTEIGASPKWKLQAQENRFKALFERCGKFPIEVKFNAGVHQTNGWNTVHFHVAPSTLLPITL